MKLRPTQLDGITHLSEIIINLVSHGKKFITWDSARKYWNECIQRIKKCYPEHGKRKSKFTFIW